MAETQTKLRITQVGTVMVPVNDQDRTVAFFIDKLGFEKRTDVRYGDGQRWVEVGPPGAATTVALVPAMEEHPAGIEARIGFSSDDVDADYATLRDRGVDVDPEVMRMGDPVPPMFWFRDPDGNRYLLVQSGS